MSTPQTITRDALRFRRMGNGQGVYAVLPNGDHVYDWDQAYFQTDITERRFTRGNNQLGEIASGPTLRDVIPELADDKTMEALRLAAKAWASARTVEREASASVHEAIRAAAALGVSETRLAKVAGVDRMTVRRALGKL